MTRHIFGGGPADWTFLVGGDGVTPQLYSVELTLWSAQTAGEQYTDLLSASGAAITTVTSSDGSVLPLGTIPPFFGPDRPDGQDVTVLWADAGTGSRLALQASTAAALAAQARTLATQAQATAQAALAAAGSGGGGGAVASVNGRAGNVILDAAAVSAVPTGGGGIIRVAEGDTTTRALAVRIPAGNRATAPDTIAIELNVGTAEAPVWRRVTFVNEYGLPRVIAATPADVMLRLKLYGPSHSADAFQLTDLDNNPLAGLRADGRWYGPNVGNARLNQGMSQPASPSVGDVWVDRTASPPVLRTWTGAQWVIVAAATGGEAPAPPAAAPAFMAKTQLYANATTFTPTMPAADTVLACLSWGTAEAPTVPAGWTLVSELVTSAARSGIWVASGSVSTLTWSWATATKASGVLAGYEACSVGAVVEAAETLVDNIHTAPAVAAAVAPVRAVRVWWDKASTTTGVSLPGGVTSRAVQYGTGGGAPSIAVGDELVSATGTVPARDATFTPANSAQSGGHSILLVKT
ncbi:hypothetical protein [Actinomadura flavalba]|uniref:hypothetical protein n=1 Tax=Actinomadura flavalba TaxID=1120938 RepID=UPI00037894D0|nr:hypothetical protein [Actinomadura flavalba]